MAALRARKRRRKRVGRVSYFWHHGAWHLYYRQGQRQVRRRVGSDESAAARVAAALDELVGSYLDVLPLDPYSGEQFLYFPQGIHTPKSSDDFAGLEMGLRYRFDRFDDIDFGIPCLWSTGTQLAKQSKSDLTAPEDAGQKPRPEGYTLREGRQYLVSGYAAWMRGQWFPIPVKQ